VAKAERCSLAGLSSSFSLVTISCSRKASSSYRNDVHAAALIGDASAIVIQSPGQVEGHVHEQQEKTSRLATDKKYPRVACLLAMVRMNRNRLYRSHYCSDPVKDISDAEGDPAQQDPLYMRYHRIEAVR